jgi:polysaccharide export outer membrane protein
MSVLAAISAAGGYTFRAQQDAVEITRTVNGRSVMGKATAADMIQPGDTVRVHEKWF